jgi:crotonobetainyl-CoA:carnitine CoA-transferase CaiB-like acyl-CoA transferase
MLSLQLADFGAEVIKIEQPGKGDPLRDWRIKGFSVHWKVYGRNKKSLTLDLRSNEGKELLLKLVEQADVLIENFRPGTLETMGVGPEVLLKRNAGIVVVRISGWGQDGPYRLRPGFGTLIEGVSGFAAKNGFEDREPVLPPLAMADSNIQGCSRSRERSLPARKVMVFIVISWLRHRIFRYYGIPPRLRGNLRDPTCNSKT